MSSQISSDDKRELSRRSFLKASTLALAGSALGLEATIANAETRDLRHAEDIHNTPGYDPYKEFMVPFNETYKIGTFLCTEVQNPPRSRKNKYLHLGDFQNINQVRNSGLVLGPDSSNEEEITYSTKNPLLIVAYNPERKDYDLSVHISRVGEINRNSKRNQELIRQTELFGGEPELIPEYEVLVNTNFSPTNENHKIWRFKPKKLTPGMYVIHLDMKDKNGRKFSLGNSNLKFRISR